MTTLAGTPRLSRKHEDTLPLRGVGAAAATVAAAVHLYVTPEHLREWWLYGGFFLAVSVAQAVLAVLVLRGPGVAITLAAIWGTLFLVGIYVLSRTAGLPITPPGDAAGGHGGGGVGAVAILPGSPDATGVEPVGTADLVALGAELLLIVVLVGLLPAGIRRVTTNLMLAVGVGAWVALGVVTIG